MTYRMSAIIEKEGRWYTALCPELDVVSQGKTVEFALANLREAARLYLESASRAELPGLSGSAPLITTLAVTA